MSPTRRNLTRSFSQTHLYLLFSFEELFPGTSLFLFLVRFSGVWRVGPHISSSCHPRTEKPKICHVRFFPLSFFITSTAPPPVEKKLFFFFPSVQPTPKKKLLNFSSLSLFFSVFGKYKQIEKEEGLRLLTNFHDAKNKNKKKDFKTSREKIHQPFLRQRQESKNQQNIS